MAWATKYIDCKFYQNGGWGVKSNSLITDLGTANGASFVNCEARHNGGTTNGFTGDAGGVYINGAASFLWIGGIVESNNWCGFRIGEAAGEPATRNIVIQNTYLELNGFNVTNGCAFYFNGPWTNVKIDNCWISYGAELGGDTNYCFFVNTSDELGGLVQEQNTFITVGAGTATRWGGTAGLGDDTAPAFSAYQVGSVNLIDVTPTILPVNTEEFDTNSNYDETTNYRFTPTVAGYYEIDAIANYIPTYTTQSYLSIFKNGVEVARGATESDMSLDVSSLIFFNGSTDYVDLRLYQDSGVTQAYNPAALMCKFWGAKIK
jgi:hypothetical protein